MRRFNLALNVSKLETKRIQLTALDAQIKSLTEKLAEVNSRRESKYTEIQEIETQIKNNTVSSETQTS